MPKIGLFQNVTLIYFDQNVVFIIWKKNISNHFQF